MIRERRSKEKLEQYYNGFVDKGALDHNIHPWVADSWRRCFSRRIETVFTQGERLGAGELAERIEANKPAVEFMDGFYDSNKDFFSAHDGEVFLVDEESYVLKNYSQVYQGRMPAFSPGLRMSERDIGTNGVSMVKEHKVPFLLFGPEHWSKNLHRYDVLAAPVIVDGRLRYIIVFSSSGGENFEVSLSPMLLSVKYFLEKYLDIHDRQSALHILLDELPVSVFCVRPGVRVTYANANGKKRLNDGNNLSGIFLNYEHIPINKGFYGTPSYNKETIWIARDRTYEDITTVLPLKTGDDVSGVIAASFSIEDIKTIIAYATGYSSRYSILSMVGSTKDFLALRNKTARVAKGDSDILLQGEPGTGKQRLAHGIHQASPRAANSLISIKCGNTAENALFSEIFGYGEESTGWAAGKLELANNGTMFIDEIEKLPVTIGNKLARSLTAKRITVLNSKKKINVRLIAACDSNLKRLTEKGLFSGALYELLSKVVLRVPALRERAEDIEMLSNHIISEMAVQHNLLPKRLTPEALSVLRQGNWPGNIKQLQGVLEVAFFHTPGTVIGADDIKLPGSSTVGKSWKHDRAAFIEAWKAAGGNISRLGVMLDVSRVTLYRYLKKYGLDKKTSV
jgi:transcriptional regulator of acetoin/glycerol metabolism